MISSLFLDAFFVLFVGILKLIPFRKLVLPNAAIDAFLGYVDMAAYFIPINTIMMLLLFIVVKEGIKIFVAFVRFILKFVPFVG